MKRIDNNMELLEAMDTVVRYLNDERGIEPWLMCGLPDGWDEDDLRGISSDPELMDGACHAFRTAMKYAKAGWFTMPYGEYGDIIAYGEDK